jgi:hypothetical protein
MTAFQRWGKGIAYAIMVAVVVAATHYYVPGPPIDEVLSWGSVCAFGFFVGWLAGAKAERKAAAATFDGGAIHVE